MKETKRMTDIPSDDRPREKLLNRGVEYLTDEELLAILLRTGVQGKNVIEMAREVIELAGGNLAHLARKDMKFFENKVKGLGNDKLATMIAAIEFYKRIQKESLIKYDQAITSIDVIGKFFMRILGNEPTECVYVVLLNAANKIIQYKMLSKGSLTESIMSPAEILKFAILHDAKSLILVHNHPSENLTPSQADISITNRMRQAGEALGIKLLDHIIVTVNGYHSIINGG